jgi:lambda family phage minor tail protein L
MTLSSVAYLEKNKLSSTGTWVVLLTVKTPGGTIIRVCPNTEDVIWPVTDGETYIAFPFEIDEIGDTSKGEVPQITIKVSNVGRVMQQHMEAEEGLVNSEVTIRIVHSIHVTTTSLGVGINNTSPEVILQYNIINAHCDSVWASFVLGAGNPSRIRFPRNRVMSGFCRYSIFKGSRCGYTGSEETCDRSLSTCKDIMGNSARFGGAPGVTQRGVYV